MNDLWSEWIFNDIFTIARGFPFPMYSPTIKPSFNFKIFHRLPKKCFCIRLAVLIIWFHEYYGCVCLVGIWFVMVKLRFFFSGLFALRKKWIFRYCVTVISFFDFIGVDNTADLLAIFPFNPRYFTLRASNRCFPSCVSERIDAECKNGTRDRERERETGRQSEWVKN